MWHALGIVILSTYIQSHPKLGLNNTIDSDKNQNIRRYNIQFGFTVHINGIYVAFPFRIDA